MTEPSRVRAVPTPPDSGRAWGAGDDPRGDPRARSSREHDRFLATGPHRPAVRPLVARSWQRCLRNGLDPEASFAPVELVDDALEPWREGAPARRRSMPVIRRLLVDDAAEAGLLVAVSDAAGRLLWVEGDAAARAAPSACTSCAGARWTEASAGTNAPGTALALDHAGADLRRRAPRAAGHAVELLGRADPRPRHRRGARRRSTSPAATSRRPAHPVPGPGDGRRGRGELRVTGSAGAGERRRRRRADRAALRDARPAGRVIHGTAAHDPAQPAAQRAAGPAGRAPATGSPATAGHRAAATTTWPPVTLRAELSRLRAAARHRSRSTRAPTGSASPSRTDADDVRAPLPRRSIGGPSPRYRRPAAARLRGARASSSCARTAPRRSARGPARAATRTRCCASPTPTTAATTWRSGSAAPGPLPPARRVAPRSREHARPASTRELG